jgi:hypothetical protein
MLIYDVLGRVTGFAAVALLVIGLVLSIPNPAIASEDETGGGCGNNGTCTCSSNCIHEDKNCDTSQSSCYCDFSTPTCKCEDGVGSYGCP